MYTIQQQLMQILIIFVLNYFEEGKKTSWLLFMNKFQLSQSYSHFTDTYIWGKIFKNGPIRICGRQPLKN